MINKKNRTSCKACRLRKCLVVGMSKSGSRYGRRSNWFKIHCLLQEQQQHHQHPNQQQLQHTPQHPSHQTVTGFTGAMGLHFQQQPHQRSTTTAGGRPSPLLESGRTPPSPWATDVKHHLRLDADNNNSVAGDLNKDGGGSGGRLSASAVAAAAAVVHAVRPELLRWPSPFFPAFPFPPPTSFFLPLPPPPPHGHSHRSSDSAESRSSSTAAADDYHDNNDDDDDYDDGQLPPPPERIAAAHRGHLPPVQETPMDLSVSAAVRVPPLTMTSRSPSSPNSNCGRSPGHHDTDRSARRRRHRHRERPPRGGDSGAEDRTSGSDRSASGDESNGSDSDRGVRTVKIVPLDLTRNGAS